MVVLTAAIALANSLAAVALAIKIMLMVAS
jgi:hypothetical protein